MSAPIVLDDGGEVEVWEDVRGEGAEAAPIAVLFVTSELESLGDSIELPGANVQLPAGTKVTVRANVELDVESGRALIAAIEEAIAPLTDEERAAEIALAESRARAPEAVFPSRETGR